MAVIILVLLFSVGVLAQQRPPLALTFRQDSSDVAYRPPSALARQVPVKKFQDDSDFASGNDPDLRTNQINVKSEVRSTNDSGCDFPFVKVGTGCYFFSSGQKNFADAEAYCATLGHDHAYEATLAMMDYDKYEDQALMIAVTERDNPFWVGGSTEDGVNWSWLDGRPLFIGMPLWFWGEPNTAANKCVAAQVSASGNNVRSYIYDSECSAPLNFICQTRFTEQIFEFRKIGSEYYFMSEEVGLPSAHWQEARDFCKDLLVPVGYHADLAVLGMPQQDDYDLMYSFVPEGTTGRYHVWIGAVAEGDDCTYKYVDGRPLPISSTYWYTSEPSCGEKKFVYLYHYAPYNKSVLYDNSESFTYPFICQLFQDV